MAEILEHHSGFTSKKAPGLDAMCPPARLSKRLSALLGPLDGVDPSDGWCHGMCLPAWSSSTYIPRIHTCSGGQRCDCKSKPSGRPREMSRTRQSWVARVRCPAIRLHQFQHGLVYFVRPRDESQCLCPTPPRCFRMRNFCDRPEPADPTATLSIIMYIHMLAVGSDSSSVGLTNNRKAVHTHPPQSRR